MKRKLIGAAGIIGLLQMGSAMATPWIDTDDVYLRHDLQVLADAGFIDTPLNTFPVMWSSIDKDLADVRADEIPERLGYAFTRVRYALNLAKNNLFNKRVKVGLSSEAPITYGFGDRPRSEGTWIESSFQYMDGPFAAKLNVSRGKGHAPSMEDEMRLDGSYLSYTLGNWALTAGYQQRWWGPGNDSTLLLSNNARPLPAISLTRVNTDGFQTPWLSWIGDWTFTTFVGRFEDGRQVNDALLWGMRANFRPMRNLEIGLARTIQMCGGERPCGLDTFSDAFVGKDNPEGEAGLRGEEPGNQLAGIDIRYSFSVMDQPFAAYAEWIGEDEEGGLPNKALKLIGAEWFSGSSQQTTKAYLEFSDTETRCFDNNAGDCAYEHDIYFSGYRQYLRSLGSTYDSDSRALVLGIAHERNNGHSWELKIKSLEINRNSSQPQRRFGGNPFSDVRIDTESISASYRLPLSSGMLTIGGEWFSEEIAVIGSPVDSSLYATWEYRL